MTALRKTGMRVSQFNTLTVLTQTGPLPMQNLAVYVADRTSLATCSRRSESVGSELLWATDSVRMVVTPAGIAALRGRAAWRAAQASVDEVLKQSGLPLCSETWGSHRARFDQKRTYT
jgi:hypothetical protein